MLTPRHVENDQTGTGRPVTVDQEEEHKIDFRVRGLSHGVVEEAEHLRVQELAKKDRKSFSSRRLHATCSRITSTPFSKNSKEMIRELGNVELFELCENYTKSSMFSLSSSLESRNCVLHLRTMLD